MILRKLFGVNRWKVNQHDLSVTFEKNYCHSVDNAFIGFLSASSCIFKREIFRRFLMQNHVASST